MTVTTRTDKGLRVHFAGQSGDFAHTRPRGRSHMVLHGDQGQAYKVIVDARDLKAGHTFGGKVIAKTVAKAKRMRASTKYVALHVDDVVHLTGTNTDALAQTASLAEAISALTASLEKATEMVAPCPELDSLLSQVEAARRGEGVNITDMTDDEMTAFFLSFD